MKVTSRLLRNCLGSRRPTDLAHVDVLAIPDVGLCEPGWQVVFGRHPVLDSWLTSINLRGVPSGLAGSVSIAAVYTKPFIHWAL